LQVVPDWALAILLFCILIVTAVRTFHNAMKKYRKENEAYELAERLNPEGESMEMEAPLVEKSEELKLLLAEDSQFPCFKVSCIMLIFLGVTAMNVAKGSDAWNPLDVQCGSPTFWYLSLGVIPYCFVFWCCLRQITVSQYHARVRANWEFHDGDVEWDEAKTVQYPIVGVLSGLIAGMFGIGGGIINGPLMAELGFNSEVTAATGATMLLFTSTTSTIMYILFGLLNFEYAGALIPLGFCATIIGQVVFNRVMAYYKRDSLIVFIIAFIVLASAILMGMEGMYVLSAAMKDGEHPAVRGICAKPYVADEISLDPDGGHNRRGLEFLVSSLNY